MKTLKFKSTIKCAGCIEKVTPQLESLPGLKSWEVNLLDPNRILTVTGELTARQVQDSLKKVGYSAEPI